MNSRSPSAAAVVVATPAPSAAPSAAAESPAAPTTGRTTDPNSVPISTDGTQFSLTVNLPGQNAAATFVCTKGVRHGAKTVTTAPYSAHFQSADRYATAIFGTYGEWTAAASGQCEYVVDPVRDASGSATVTVVVVP